MSYLVPFTSWCMVPKKSSTPTVETSNTLDVLYSSRLKNIVKLSHSPEIKSLRNTHSVEYIQGLPASVSRLPHINVLLASVILKRVTPTLKESKGVTGSTIEKSPDKMILSPLSFVKVFSQRTITWSTTYSPFKS